MQMIRFYVCSQGGDLSITFLFYSIILMHTDRDLPVQFVCIPRDGQSCP